MLFKNFFTKGKCIFASGSPFLPVTLTSDICPENRSLVRSPGQANNSYVFPGLALGIVSGQISPVLNEDFLIAAEVRKCHTLKVNEDVELFFPILNINLFKQ